MEVVLIKQNVKVIKADLSKHDFIYLVPLSDFHWDEPQSDHDTIKGYVDWIASHKNAYTLLNGDLVTAPTEKSAANLYEMAEPGGTIEFPSLDQCSDELEALLKPIAKRILAACSGGHELKNVFRATGTDWTYNLMKRLGIQDRYCRDGGVLLMRTKPLTIKDDTFFTAYFTHGYGGARTRGAKINKIDWLTKVFHADIYIMSHDHTQNLTRANYMEVPEWDLGHPNVHRKILVSTGAFRSYAGYPLRSGYEPSDLGTPRIRIGKKIDEDGVVRKDVHASL